MAYAWPSTTRWRPSAGLATPPPGASLPPYPIAMQPASWIAFEISSATHQGQRQMRERSVIIIFLVEEILWDWIVKIMNCNRAEVGHL